MAEFSFCSLLRKAKARFLQIADDYTWLNPHLRLAVDWFGQQASTAPTDPGWKKWLPSEPTSPHWYRREELQRLACAYVAHDEDRGAEGRTVREFISEFRGLTGTAKQKAVLEATGLTRTTLAALCNGKADSFDSLLSELKKASKLVKPAALGCIGRDHLTKRFVNLGCEMQTSRYRRVREVGADGLPTLVESAFAWRGDECKEPRRIITGVNWSPGIVNPFRSFGSAYGDGLAALLEKQYAGEDEPIVFLLHSACPRVQYQDRGKSSVAME